jgi:hypothetical protein
VDKSDGRVGISRRENHRSASTKESPPAGVPPAHRYKWRQVFDYCLDRDRRADEELVEWNVEDTAKAIGFPVVAGERAIAFADRYLAWDGIAENDWQ